MQNSLWVLKLYQQCQAWFILCWKGLEWLPHQTAALELAGSLFPPPGPLHMEDSPGQEPTGSAFRGVCAWLPLQGASACSGWASSSGLGALCPGREQATSSHCRHHRWTESPTDARKQGSLKPQSQPYRQGLHPAHLIPAGAEFTAAWSSFRLLQAGQLLRPAWLLKPQP